MNSNTLTLKRLAILGELYKQCDCVSSSIPVYINDTNAEPVGTLRESPDRNSDAFLFSLPENVCKKMAMNFYDVGIDCDYNDTDKTSKKDRIKLNHIILAVKPEAAPVPRRNQSTSTVRR